MNQFLCSANEFIPLGEEIYAINRTIQKNYFKENLQLSNKVQKC